MEKEPTIEKEPILEKEPIIEFRGVTKRFDVRTILDKVDFKIYEGEVTTLIGLSGTGKSVTLKHIIGLLKPDEGQVLYRGKPIDQMSKKEWKEYMGSISYMFQNNALFDSMTIVENVALPLRQTTHLGKKEITEKAMASIEQTELTEVFDKYPSELSGGMQKRAALARALVHDPQVLLLDEPFGALDALTREALWQELLRIWQANRKTVVMVTHSVSEAIFLADRVLVLGARPAVVVGEVVIDLPRPRTRETFAAPDFGSLTRRVREALDLASA